MDQILTKFIIRLDEKPTTWEYAISLYGTYLYSRGIKSSTIKSYVSAISKKLAADDYHINHKKVLLSVLTRTCKLKNDEVMHRFPIKLSLLELLLSELERKFVKQPYLEILYKALFVLAYYGLMRIGELALGDHSVKAKDVYSADNKNKILLVLHSSKTHGKESLPQTISITENENAKTADDLMYCPFKITNKFLDFKGSYKHDDENLFTFRDGTPVKPEHVRTVLRELLKKLNLNEQLYDTHSFRIGRATDLFKSGFSLEYIKRVGRWKSNAVYRYLRNL